MTHHAEPTWIAELARIAEGSFDRGVHFMVSHQARFNDPLVAIDRARLSDLRYEGPQEARILEVAELIAVEGSGPSIYFPVPMARTLPEGEIVRGEAFDAASARFHYDLIHVDGQQRWTWRGTGVAERTRQFFLEHMAWQADIGRWFFEYKVHDGWWDKSYLDAEMTPFTAHRLEEEGVGADAAVTALLTSGQRVRVLPGELLLDDQERLYVRSESHGDILLSETERFRLLRTADGELTQVEVAGEPWSLRWP